MTSNRLDQIASYFNEKEKRRLAEVARNSKGGLPEMTLDEIRLSCMENDGYDSPELNEKLYLHFKGYKKIENLDQYTGCKALWLDSNGLERIEGLNSLVNLRCLYLPKNLISKIEGLELLVNLTSIDLSNNRITRIENLAQCVSLQTINLSRNALSDADSLQHLVECVSVDNLDLTHNSIEGDDIVERVFSRMSKLVALSVTGNPLVQMPSFRKLTLVAVPKLCYLDRPVEEVERLGAQAFVSGGVDAEKEARDAWREEQRQNRKNEMESFRTWQREQYAARQQAGLVGKSCYITEFSEGEKIEREMEARKAAEDEKRMLDLGIGRLGERYWQMQGRAGAGEDPLQLAVDSLLKEDESRNAADAAAVEVDGKEQDEEESVAVENVTVEIEEAAGGAAMKDDVATVVVEVKGGTVEGEEDIAPEAASGVTVKGEEEAVVEVESQDVRDQRVQESLEIWRRQQAEIREKEMARNARQHTMTVGYENTQAASKPLDDHENIASLSSALSSRHPTTNTWDSASAVVPVNPKCVYWTEWMDLKLAELVRTCVFDFVAIANTFHSIASSEEEFKKVPGYGLPRHAELRSVLHGLTDEACRLRWADLDARRWSSTDEDGAEGAAAEGGKAVSPPVYRVCIKPDELGKGHGAQPSFQAMASMASGSMPAYLKVPTSFPSTREFEDGDDTDNDDASLERLD